MPYYLLLTRSITQAQRMSAALEKGGVSAPYSRAPMALTDRGCGYAVRLNPQTMGRAVMLLKAAGMAPSRTFLAGGEGGYREVSFPP